MKDPYKKQIIRKCLLKVLPELVQFINNSLSFSNIEELAAGDLYTRLRRELHKDLKSYDVINRKNIDRIYVDEGIILHLGFIKQSYAGADANKVIDYFNEILEELEQNPKFYHKLYDDCQFNNIINSINNFEIT